MTTDQAFTQMINTPRIESKLKIKVSTMYSLRRRNINGQYISTDKKMELLKSAGYTIKKEMEWDGV